MNDPGQELNVSARKQMPWRIPVDGEQRCSMLGHEADQVLTLNAGMLVAYCIRCTCRIEMPWFRGGTAVALARAAAQEALGIEHPSRTVQEDLEHLLGLLVDDRATVDDAIAAVDEALVVTRRRLQP